MNERELDNALRLAHRRWHNSDPDDGDSNSSEYPLGASPTAKPYWTLITRYFPRRAWLEATWILDCESGGNPLAHNTNGEDSRGLFQVNVGPGANTDMGHLNLYDPEENIKAAGIIYGYYNDWRLWWNCAKKLGYV